MAWTPRWIDRLVAACIVVAFGCLFVGRLMLYPVAAAGGTFLERVAAQSEAWHRGHVVMLVGILAMIPAAIGIRRALHARAAWLVDVATGLILVGSALAVGQYALDFALLAAAQIDPPQAGVEFQKNLRENPVVDWAFYKLPDLSQLGLILVIVALWRQGPSWRIQAALVTLAAVSFLVASRLGSLGARAGLGLLFLAFASVAWKIAASGGQDPVETDETPA